MNRVAGCKLAGDFTATSASDTFAETRELQRGERTYIDIRLYIRRVSTWLRV